MSQVKTPRDKPSAPWRLSFVILLYLAVAVIVNPAREYAFSDDWAYALTVRHLVETGQHQLSPWAAANMPFQIYWGALFSAIFGFSLSTLHLSTIVLAVAGLAAFYGLAQEHGIASDDAALLTLILLASPIVLEFSFTFMTDVPYLACMTVALFLFTRAIRKQSYPFMLAGGLAGSAAILTRQFGVILIPGLIFAWALGNNRKQSSGLFTSGLAPLVLASAWQAYSGLVTPNWTGILRSREQIQFLAAMPQNPIELIWRLAVSVEYMALFAIPLVLPMIADFLHDLRQRLNHVPPSGQARRRFIRVAGLLTGFMIAHLLGVILLHHPGVLPLISWNLDVIAKWPRLLSSALSLLVMCGGVLLSEGIVRTYTSGKWKQMSQHQWLLDATGLFTLGIQLFYLHFGDEYLIVFLPYVLIAAWRAFSSQIKRLRGPTAVAAALLLIASTLWVRATLGQIEAQWTAAARLLERGAQPEQIYTYSWEWNSYAGAFDDYLREVNPPPSTEAIAQYFGEWLSGRRNAARYLITPLTGGEDLSGWAVVDRVVYQDGLLRRQTIYTLKRQP